MQCIVVIVLRLNIVAVLLLITAQEQINRESYNETSDMWALGCLVYEITTLRPPFTATVMSDLIYKINQGRFARIPFRYSDELNDVVCQLLQVDVSSIYVTTFS